MKKKSIFSYYTKFTKRILSLRFLSKLNLHKNIIENAIKSNKFVKEFGDIFYNEDLSCKNVCNLFIMVFNDGSEGDFPNWSTDEWLQYIYGYTLFKSFPDSISMEINTKLNKYCDFYLRLLMIFNDFEKELSLDTFVSKYPLTFLTEKEKLELEYPEEYLKFVSAFENENIYELMKINKEITGYNTLDHICGVHYLALNIARQLKDKNLSVDLGRVSGAAAGHDIGKFGCKTQEIKRVPYLHYYYTDKWFLKHGINYIRNIAINHSTWDLELENLPLESLILIYCDFRVKNTENPLNNSMNIFSLQDSFQIILNKLDNLDASKEKRYKNVYSKLLDFENYLKNIGININPYLKDFNESSLSSYNKEYALLQGSEITKSIKNLAINHNISLMYHLRDEYSLEGILEVARSEKDWKKLREYIRIFEEYSTYLTQRQKIQTLNFLYDNLIHPEDDIRRHCAEIIGSLIAYFDEDYRKEIPSNVSLPSSNINSYTLFDEYITKLLYPSHKVIPQHRYWMGYNLSLVCKSLFNSSKGDFTTYRDILIKYFDTKRIKNSDMHLFLLECIKYIPLKPLDHNINILIDFIFNSINKKNTSIKLCAVESLIHILKTIENDENLNNRARKLLKGNNNLTLIPAEHFLINKLNSIINKESYSKFSYNKKLIPNIYLNNLKSATEWVVKKNNILLLLDYTLENPNTNALQTAIHFCNILKVSAVESVRNQAGTAIIKLMPHLNSFEKNEVAVELLRALEIEGHKFTEYIPIYLGQVLLFLDDNELEEIIDDLIIKIKIATPNVKTLILKTVSITLQYLVSKTDFNAVTKESKTKFVKLLGILFNGLGDYNSQVSMSAFSCFGKGIFNSSFLNLEKKQYIYTLIAKKILNLVSRDKEDDLLLLSNAAALNHIYRFISDYNFHLGEIIIETPKKIAFFPGTFDPFSISHKEISLAIRNLGYEVYLAVDEFSWSKRTLPNQIRRNIINMTMSSELNIYIFPDNLPINLSNAKDLKILRESFPLSEVFIVIGSDVILNASSYKQSPSLNTIHSFSHIIIDRGKYSDLKYKFQEIKGNVEVINLSTRYKDISSTQIRNYIDDSKDISSLIDPMAQQFIYENGFYQKEPLDKSHFISPKLETVILNHIENEQLIHICNVLELGDEAKKSILLNNSNNSSRILLLKEIGSDVILGLSQFHWTRSEMLFKELKDVEASQNIRENSSGRLITLDALLVKNSDKSRYFEQLILSETLAYCLSRDYQYAMCNFNKKMHSFHLPELLKNYGFKAIITSRKDIALWLVNMSTPCVINYDIENFIKEPFKSNTKVKQGILLSRNKLQQALCNLYPGELILPIDSNMLHYGLIKKICTLNKVPMSENTLSIPEKEILKNKTSLNKTNSKVLGDYMCVPYGDILDKYVIPNTVTKALHTEKYFNPDMDSFRVDASPYFLNLANQVKMIKSFNRSVILVDTILHKGYRMKALDPLLKKENIHVEKIIVGILSARGKDLMEFQNREVECVYFIPRLRLWFNESSMYPFIGGDALWRGKFPKRNIVPSINLILPYTSPTFIRGASKESIFQLSKTSMENSIDILSTIETVFHKLYERNLSMLSLGQVITIPRYPDHGKDMHFDFNLTPTHYLKNDLELLNRLNYIIRS